MVDLHSSREAGSAQGPPSATERRECKSRVTLLLRDADSGQIDHMAAEHTHGPHHPCTSSRWPGARGPFLAIGNFQLDGGSTTITQCIHVGSDGFPTVIQSVDRNGGPKPPSPIPQQKHHRGGLRAVRTTLADALPVTAVVVVVAWLNARFLM